jgi:hypothetical protein
MMVSLNKKEAPIIGAIVVPKELKAWDKFNLLEAPTSDPQTATYGFAATCKIVIPAAKVKYPKMKMPNIRSDAAGENKTHPNAITVSPRTIPF